ncbi:hypothetical protein [Kutzneria albida]|uniref:hypothetical protein n=1 Tax=Kutzneria albida TaxID=43357 RepID=UPI003B839F94
MGQAAADLGVSREMVCKWLPRFLTGRLEGLSDEPRPGRLRLITKTLEETSGAGHALAAPGDGAVGGPVAVGGIADLAGVRAHAARGQDLEAVNRSPVRGQGVHPDAGDRCRPRRSCR